MKTLNALTILIVINFIAMAAMADCQIQCRDTGWGNQSCQTVCQNQQPAARIDTSMYQRNNQYDAAADLQNIQLRQLEIQRRQFELQQMQYGH